MGLEAIVDLQHYPIDDLRTARAQRVIEEQQRALDTYGVAIMPGFVAADALARIAADALATRDRAHLEDVWGTPYLGLAEPSYPDDHPRRFNVHSLTWVIAHDVIPPSSPVRALYQSEELLAFISAILQIDPLYRMADPLGALNLTIMEEGHVQGWHYDNTDFVVSLAVQASEGGGEFECAASIRSDDDENYESVARVLREEPAGLVEILPMTPGTLMVFRGRNSLHRVSAVRGVTARIVALFAYDRRPDADSNELFKLVRYGRSEPIPA